MDLTTCLILVTVFIVTYYFLRRPRNLPPGPFSLPLVGSLFFMQKIRTNHFDRVLAEAAKKYGNVMSFWIGPQLFLSINGYKLIHEAYAKRPDEFGGRPFAGRLIQRAFKTNKADKGVLFNDYNHNWRIMRRFTLQVLRDFGVGKTSIEEKILTEISAVSTYLQKAEGKPFSINIYLHYIVSNTIFGIIFGKRFDYEDEEFNSVIGYTRAALSGAGLISLGNVFPESIVKLISKSQADSDANQVWGIHSMDAYTRKQVAEHETTFDKNNIRDFIDLYIQSVQEEGIGEESKHIEKEDLFRTIMDLFLAGSDTTSSALDWLFLYMSEYPEVQKKCQKEISEVLGDRTVSYADKAKLPYVEATILEIQRMSCVLKENVPHCTLCDTTFEGYNIPKGTIVFSTIRSIMTDPNHWVEPDQFRPERHLDANGKLARNEAMNPFSTGPRQCLGEPLAKMELFLVFANLLQQFEFKPEKPDVRHSMEPIFQHATNPPLPYKQLVYSRLGVQ